MEECSAGAREWPEIGKEKESRTGVMLAQRTRDQPNNDVRTALEGGLGRSNSFCMGVSSSAGFSGPVFSVEVGSSPTNAITNRRAWT